jgi:hydrogenase nickel incorporation protein HypB
MSPEPRMVEVRKNVLKPNDVIARALRERFRDEGILAVSLINAASAALSCCGVGG